MPKAKFIYGVGNNDSDYKVSKSVDGKKVVCEFYRAWSNMLERCYSGRHPSYANTKVSKEWLSFSNFKAWMVEQDYAGKYLDKDILCGHSKKIYSPETCCFISSEMNMFMTDRGAARKKGLIGSYFKKSKNLFEARCKNPFSGKNEHLGYYKSGKEAHLAWASRKLEHAKRHALSLGDERVAKALVEYYEHYLKA